MTGVSEVLARPSAHWPLLVGDQVWQRVQERLDGHRRVPRQASGRFLLTGLLRCPACGGRVVGQSATRSMAKPRYRCGSDAKGSCCTQTADLERVERPVMHRVGAVVDAVATDGGVRRALRKTWQTPREERPSADQERRVGQLEAMLERARGRVVRATELLVDGTIERGAYDELMRKARAEIAAAEAKLGSVSPGGPPAQPSLPPLADVLAAVGEWATSLGGTDVGAQRAVLTVLADRVVAVRERVGVYRTEITWTPLGARLARIAERHDVG